MAGDAALCRAVCSSVFTNSLLRPVIPLADGKWAALARRKATDMTAAGQEASAGLRGNGGSADNGKENARPTPGASGPGTEAGTGRGNGEGAPGRPRETAWVRAMTTGSDKREPR